MRSLGASGFHSETSSSSCRLSTTRSPGGGLVSPRRAQPCCSSPFAPACPSHKVLIHCPSRVAHISGGNNCARSRAFREVGIRAVRPEAFPLESKSQSRSRVSPCSGKSRGQEQRVAG